MKLATLFLIAFSLEAQQMHVKPFTDAAITITASAAKPFAIEVTNNGTDPIEAIRIEWEYTRAENAALGSEGKATYDPVGMLLQPGSSKVFFPRTVGDRIKAGTEASVKIDGLLYASGRVAGENKFGIDKHMALMAEVERYVAIGVIKRGPKQHVPWLQSLTAGLPAGDARFGGGAFWRSVFIRSAANNYLDLQNLGAAAVMTRAKANMERAESRLRHEVSIPRGGR